MSQYLIYFQALHYRFDSWTFFQCYSTTTSKGQVIRAIFSFNLWRNIVALQVERFVARITSTGSTCQATISCKLQEYVAQSRPESYFLQYDLFHILFVIKTPSRGRKDPLKFASLPTCGFVAQLVERPTSIWEARVQAPSKPEFFQDSFLQFL